VVVRAWLVWRDGSGGIGMAGETKCVRCGVGVLVGGLEEGWWGSRGALNGRATRREDVYR